MRYLLVLKLYANDSLTLYVCFQIHSTNTSLSSGMQLTYLCKAKTLSQIKSTLGSIPPLADVSHIALPTLRPEKPTYNAAEIHSENLPYLNLSSSRIS